MLLRLPLRPLPFLPLGPSMSDHSARFHTTSNLSKRHATNLHNPQPLHLSHPCCRQSQRQCLYYRKVTPLPGRRVLPMITHSFLTLRSYPRHSLFPHQGRRELPLRKMTGIRYHACLISFSLTLISVWPQFRLPAGRISVVSQPSSLESSVYQLLLVSSCGPLSNLGSQVRLPCFPRPVNC